MRRLGPLLTGLLFVFCLPPAHAQQAVTGSTAPCQVPMQWTVARVDEQFDLSEAEVDQALREAGRMWEVAVGTRLFDFESSDGSPIYFDYDRRQAEVEEGQERERALEAERSGIEAHSRALQETAREYESAIQEYERDATEFGWAVRNYNNDMARASRDNDLPASERRELQRRGDDLERRERRLNEQARDLNRQAEDMQREADRLNEWVEEFNRRGQSHVGAFPESPTQAGHYDETLLWQGAETEVVSRRIRVFQFSDYAHLVITLAHELGHALGVGHVPAPGSLMSAILVDDAESLRVGGLTQPDVQHLRAICPDLGGA